eukprot:9912844-Ditylum_brightwellii.AAC.1
MSWWTRMNCPKYALHVQKSKHFLHIQSAAILRTTTSTSSAQIGSTLKSRMRLGGASVTL